MNLASLRARYAAQHEKKPFHDGTFHGWSAERTPDAPFHFTDGVSLYVSEQEPAEGEDFLTDAKRPIFPA